MNQALDKCGFGELATEGFSEGSKGGGVRVRAMVKTGFGGGCAGMEVFEDGGEVETGTVGSGGGRAGGADVVVV